MMQLGVRLFVAGWMVLCNPFANAQNTLVIGAEVTPPDPAAAFPLRPVEMQPKAPKITCRGDQLTISADNSTLEAILFAVKGCTGAHIDIPEGAGRVRSFEEIGPGPVRQVLDQLLSGTQYNYVIQSSEANPGKVETVLMSMRTNDADKAVGVSADLPITPGRRAWQHMQKFDKPDPVTGGDPNARADEDSTSSVEIASPGSESANAAQAKAGEAAASDAVAGSMTPVAPPILDPGSSADPGKALHDRIGSMQEMFSQRQAMIQKQNQSQSGAPNN